MIGILLLNLGTPASPLTSDVRKYLQEFLSDPRVIDIPAIARWMLVNLVVAPFRSPKSAKSYQKIWTTEGSPLLVYTERSAKKLQQELGPEYLVEVGMRYGEPSIESALKKLQGAGVKEIRALPLYPQYADSSTGSTVAKLFELQKKISKLPNLQILSPFFDQEDFLDAWFQVGNPLFKEFSPDHTLFSFHGLPERQILKEDISENHCLKSENCCEKMVPANGLCYRAHCFQTAYGITHRMNLPKENYTICFQSRLGRTPWIQPFTDVVIEELARQGKKRLLVFCPSFVADCLETLEEIAIRAKEQFIKAGGEDLQLVPSLNDHPAWILALKKMFLST